MRASSWTLATVSQRAILVLSWSLAPALPREHRVPSKPKPMAPRRSPQVGQYSHVCPPGMKALFWLFAAGAKQGCLAHWSDCGLQCSGKLAHCSHKPLNILAQTGSTVDVTVCGHVNVTCAGLDFWSVCLACPCGRFGMSQPVPMGQAV